MLGPIQCEETNRRFLTYRWIQIAILSKCNLYKEKIDSFLNAMSELNKLDTDDVRISELENRSK